MKNMSLTSTRRTLLKGALCAGAALLIKPQLVFGSLTQKETAHTQTRLLLGTFVTLTVLHQSKSLAEEALGKTFEYIAHLEAELTRHKNSALTELNSTGKLLSAPRHLLHVLQQSAHIHSLTHGAFDVSVTPLLDLYAKAKNPHGDLQLDQTKLQEAKALVQAKEVYISQDHVRLGRQGMQVTLDGIAKGYIADEASKMLTKLGIGNHLVNAGGDIKVSGQKNNSPWQIGIENPENKGKLIRNIKVQGAIATSGNYEMFYDAQKKYHHLIDPKRLQSSQYSVSVSVMAPTALEADALATALSAMPSSAALKLINTLPGRECMLISAQGHILASHNFV